MTKACAIDPFVSLLRPGTSGEREAAARLSTITNYKVAVVRAGVCMLYRETWECPPRAPWALLEGPLLITRNAMENRAENRRTMSENR